MISYLVEIFRQQGWCSAPIPAKHIILSDKAKWLQQINVMQNYVLLALWSQKPERHCYLQHGANTQKHLTAIEKKTKNKKGFKIVVKLLY